MSKDHKEHHRHHRDDHHQRHHNDHHHRHNGDNHHREAKHDSNDDLHGDRGKDHLNGHRGDDRLEGRNGDDKLKGGSGNDHLNGGAGHDILDGGPGHDHFDFTSLKDSTPGKNHDVIRDFHRGDKIDLHHIDAKDGPGNQHFHWIGDDAFSNKDGELRYEKQGNHVVVQGDTNGDGNADFELVVNNVHTLHGHDFIL